MIYVIFKFFEYFKNLCLLGLIVHNYQFQVKVWFQNRRMKHKRQAMTKTEDGEKKPGSRDENGINNNNNNTKSAPSSPESLCNAEMSVKKEDTLSEGSVSITNSSSALVQGVKDVITSASLALAQKNHLDTKVKEESNLCFQNLSNRFASDGIKDSMSPTNALALHTPPNSRNTPPLTPLGPTNTSSPALGNKVIPRSPVVTSPALSHASPRPVVTSVTTTASSQISMPMTVANRIRQQQPSFPQICPESKGRGTAPLISQTTGSYPSSVYRGPTGWANGSMDQFRNVGSRGTPPHFVANSSSPRLSNAYTYDYSVAQQQIHQQQNQSQRTNSHVMYNNGYAMENYGYNRHYYNNNMACGDGYGYGAMYSSGNGMYGCSQTDSQQYYDHYGNMSGYEQVNEKSMGATVTGNPGTVPGVNQMNVASMNYFTNSQNAGETAVYHEHYQGGGGHEPSNFGYNFFDQTTETVADVTVNGTGGGGSTSVSAHSENSNSSDFNFLSNLANDFAPEYYQLS